MSFRKRFLIPFLVTAIAVAVGIPAGLLFAGTGDYDTDGREIILDADGDTSIQSLVDDKIAFKIGGNTAWTLSQGNVPTTTIFKTTTESITNDSVLSNDAVLNVAVQANAEYLLRYKLYTNWGGVGKFKYEFVEPTGATFEAIEHSFPNTSANFRFNEGTGAKSLAWGCTGSGCAVFFDIYLTTSTTSGNFNFQWAQDVSDGTATAVEVGSSVQYYRVDAS